MTIPTLKFNYPITDMAKAIDTAATLAGDGAESLLSGIIAAELILHKGGDVRKAIAELRAAIDEARPLLCQSSDHAAYLATAAHRGWRENGGGQPRILDPNPN